MTEADRRKEIVDGALELERLGLNHGSAGNLSLRVGEAVLVTPSGVPARAVRTTDHGAKSITSIGGRLEARAS